VLFLVLSAHAVRPAAPDYSFTTDSTGVPAVGWVHRLVLAWSRQTGALFEPLPLNTRLTWHLDPKGRFGRLAPQIIWGEAKAHLIDGDLVWVSDGYVTSSTFPMVERAQWRGRDIASIDAPFLGVITASTGETHIYRRPTADSLGAAWQEITGVVAEPWADVPPSVLTELSYPDELFEVEARVMERTQWLGSHQASRGSTDRGRTSAMGWSRADTSLVSVAAFESPGRRTLSAVAVGRSVDGIPRLLLTRLSNRSFRSPSVLDADWSRFATYEQLRDSLRSAAAQAESSPVGMWIESDGFGAYQTIFGLGPERHLALAWVNLAVGDSLGAGRNVNEAWQNLRGLSAPLLTNAHDSQLAEAERWMAVADSAIKRGDWTTFGRAFEALRQVLKPKGE
jgi:hypothetical protein